MGNTKSCFATLRKYSKTLYMVLNRRFLRSSWLLFVRHFQGHADLCDNKRCDVKVTLIKLCGETTSFIVLLCSPRPCWGMFRAVLDIASQVAVDQNLLQSFCVFGVCSSGAAVGRSVLRLTKLAQPVFHVVDVRQRQACLQQHLSQESI